MVTMAGDEYSVHPTLALKATTRSNVAHNSVAYVSHVSISNLKGAGKRKLEEPRKFVNISPDLKVINKVSL